MKASGIICEYNPFHKGHKHQIDVIKSKSENPIVAIMSGNFTQRGDIAVIDKFKRTEIALDNGVDLVIELPTVYAVSSAKNFAKAGVRIAQALGVTENLCFSAEEKNTDLLTDIPTDRKVKGYVDDAVAAARAAAAAAILKVLLNGSVPRVGEGVRYVVEVEHLKLARSSVLSQPLNGHRLGAVRLTDELRRFASLHLQQVAL